MFDSKFKLISRGFAAENKKRNTKLLKVIPIEIFPDLEDDLTTAETTVTSVGIDATDQSYSMQVVKCATVEAVWIGDTNRDSAPDIRRKERINLYQVADSETLYWEAAGLDDDLRRLETVRWKFNANPNNDGKKGNHDDTWTFEISTHDGHATFRTTQKNGEAAAWVCQFDCLNGKFTVEDEKGNYAYIDSVRTDIQLQNADKTRIQLTKDTLNLEAKTWNNVVSNWDVKAEVAKFDIGSFALKTDNCKLDLGKADIQVKGTTSYKAAATTIDGPVLFKSPITLAGGFLAKMAPGGGSAGKIEGELEAGTMIMKDLKADNITGDTGIFSTSLEYPGKN